MDVYFKLGELAIQQIIGIFLLVVVLPLGAWIQYKFGQNLHNSEAKVNRLTRFRDFLTRSSRIWEGSGNKITESGHSDSQGHKLHPQSSTFLHDHIWVLGCCQYWSQTRFQRSLSHLDHK